MKRRLNREWECRGARREEASQEEERLDEGFLRWRAMTKPRRSCTMPLWRLGRVPSRSKSVRARPVPAGARPARIPGRSMLRNFKRMGEPRGGDWMARRLHGDP